MKLKDLFTEGIPYESQGNLDVEIVGLQSDSRKVKRGDLFVAVKGEKQDGHEHIAEAISAGAVAVVCENDFQVFPSTVRVKVADGRMALAQLASRFHGQPSQKLTMVGITGTNGKTTTSYLIASILEAAGIKTGVLGTLAYRIGNRELPAPNTTPGADQLHELLRQMVQSGLKAAVMEVSSHSLVQRRVEGIAWDAAVFTNFTQDHLDYHRTMENYFEAKKTLFQQLDPNQKKAVAILNQDDERSEKLKEAMKDGVRILTYGLNSKADVRADLIEQSVSGCSFQLKAGDQVVQIQTPLCGLHNVSNCLAAAATGLAMGLRLDVIQTGLQSVSGVSGRLERVISSRHPTEFAIFVDYAHTDDALRNVLKTLKPLAQGKLILVFGCGGNRDEGKRLLMGKVAAQWADFSVLTTDNPRFEDPEIILDQIARGFEGGAPFQIVADRREAIRKAIFMAGKGDVVLLAGKGHETYQEIQGVRAPFDDRKMALEILEEWAEKGGATWKN